MDGQDQMELKFSGSSEVGGLELCIVCGDRASGRHYGAISCEDATMSTPDNKTTKMQLKKFPRKIIQKVNERRKQRRQWHKTRYPYDKTRLNNATKELKNMIKEHKNRTLQYYLYNLTAHKYTNYSLWRATKNLKRPKDHVSPLRKQDGSWAKSEVEKATAFAEHLKQVFTPLPSSDPDKDYDITDYLQSPNQLCFPLKAVRPGEIKNLTPKKAPGYDLLDSVLLKAGGAGILSTAESVQLSVSLPGAAPPHLRLHAVCEAGARLLAAAARWLRAVPAAHALPYVHSRSLHAGDEAAASHARYICVRGADGVPDFLTRKLQDYQIKVLRSLRATVQDEDRLATLLLQLPVLRTFSGPFLEDVFFVGFVGDVSIDDVIPYLLNAER
ncbi:hypothetical protein HF086_017569 [Spodoptera exigua]|uniref:Nuclear receptor domain-containing protein n=1 Tax=Spodoptera exigua TaxID=7107 RepID=A0A922MJT5_SPOEX|nr:hypothetical protein HF086_017569 [Spodoptera exigua]